MAYSEHEWDEFYKFVYKKADLDLYLYKASQLQRRVAAMVEAEGLKDLKEFAKHLGSSDANITAFLDKLAINVSELYRNPEKWTELEKIVIPELYAKNKNLKIWSAGCSYGAEAYSLATMLDSKFKGNHTIFCSDIDTEAMNQAKQGIFSDLDVKNVPKNILKEYFIKDGKHWKASESLRKYFKFSYLNLLKDKFDTNYDLILCRNVVIYFTDKAQVVLYERFSDSLKMGGYFLTGSTERIPNYHEIGFETKISFLYKKTDKGRKIWQNAS